MKIERDPKKLETGQAWKIRAVTTAEAPAVRKIQKFLHTLVLRRLSSDSIRSYAYDLVLIHKWLAQSRLRLDKIKGKHQFQFIDFQNELKHKRASINRRLVTLRCFYFFCTGKDLERVGKGMSLPPGHYRGAGKEFLGVVSRPRKTKTQLKIRQPKMLIVPLKPDEVNLFLKGLKNYRDLAIVAIMLFCGLRSMEVRLLDLADVDFERRELRVRGKGSKERLVPLPDTVIRLIQDYLKWERPMDIDSHALFLVTKGPTKHGRLTAAGFRNFFRYRRKVSGIHQANPHRFRHSFGTNLARSGVNLRVLQELLGHSPGSPVTQRYLHLAISDVADAFHAVHRGLEMQYVQFK
ncbi:tyrosine-type recombinase/integrase [Bdellovibrionota bacterium FG-2]